MSTHNLTQGPHKGRLLFSGWRNLQAGAPDGEVGVIGCEVGVMVN